MKLNRVLLSIFVVTLSFGVMVTSSHADRDKRDKRDKSDTHDKSYTRDKSYKRDKSYRRDNRSSWGQDWKSHSDKYHVDKRYRHNQYYPQRGYKIDRIPTRHHRISYRGSNYYYYSGAWYSPFGGRFVVVAPPFGIVVPTLPSLYTTLWIGGMPYYYANDVYYVWRPDRNGYVVTEPPANVDQQAKTVLDNELFIYPKQGQSEQKQADDRYACHKWSVGQTRYDPSQPPKDLSTKQVSDQRYAYQRAMRACLEGRGYSVR